MSTGIIVRQVLINGKMVVEFDLLRYRHVWLSPYLLAVEQAKGWMVYEVLKVEPDLLLVKEVGKLRDIEEVEACIRRYAI